MKNNSRLARLCGLKSIGIGQTNKQYKSGNLDEVVMYFVKKYGYVRIYPDRKEMSVRIKRWSTEGMKLDEFKREFEIPYIITKIDGVGDCLWITIRHEVTFD